LNGPIRSALGFTSCIGENEEASPWKPLHGFDPGDSTVAVLAAEAPQIVAVTRSRSAVDLLATIADGWSKARAATRPRGWSSGRSGGPRSLSA
jgi:hypothetical protein